jgi:hypothetical protein
MTENPIRRYVQANVLISRDLGHTLAEIFDDHGLHTAFAALGEAVTTRSLEAFALEGRALS